MDEMDAAALLLRCSIWPNRTERRKYVSSRYPARMRDAWTMLYANENAGTLTREESRELMTEHYAMVVYRCSQLRDQTDVRA